MGEEPKGEDLLAKWLDSEGLATLDRIIGGSTDVLGIIDRDYVIRYVTHTAPGLTREGVVGHSTFNLIPPESTQSARESFDHVLSTGEPSSFEMTFSSERGPIVYVVRVSPVLNQGEVIGAFTVSSDVTEERRGTVDRDRFFSLSLDMLIVTTPEGVLRRINPAFAQALGLTVCEIVGRRFLDFVHPDDIAPTMQAFQKVLKGTRVSDFENRYRRQDGSYRIFSWRATADPVTGDVYAVARDVTDHRETEAALRTAQKMEAVGLLAGGIAHDFNNLMQAVLANVDLSLAEGGTSSSVREHLHEIEGAGERAAELTKQLLVFSRRQPLNRVPLDVNELLQGLLKLLRRLLPENIAIEIQPGANLPAVSADRSQFEQVVMNLSVNARDAMADGGRLTFRTTEVQFSPADCEVHPWAKPGRFVCLGVTDTGVGMSPEVKERAFDPFFTTKAQGSGTGLGLATLYGIVEQHGGFVHVYSDLGHGTTFKVFLAADERSGWVGVSGDDVAPSATGTETILLAEDEEAVRRAVVRMLTSAGYRTISAENGREAVELLKANLASVDLVVLDVVMPEMGGPEAWQQMSKLRPDLGVIFTSGYADARFREHLPRDAELVDKPFRTRDLIVRIRAKLDEKRA